MICWLSNGDGPLGGQHYKPSVVVVGGGGVGGVDCEIKFGRGVLQKK